MAENLSGVPPAVSLSGLDAGAGGFSGATQQSLGGSGAYGTGMPGMTGGMDLNSLMQLLAGGAEAGVGTGGDIGQSLAQGSLGQQQGGFGAGSFGQTQPQPGYVAGQSSAGAPGSMGAGSADPFALIQKTLGLAQKGAGMLGQTQTASPVLGMQSDMAGSDPQAFAAQREGERQDFTASPYNMAGQSPFITGETGLGPDANQIAGEMSGGYAGAPGSGFGDAIGANPDAAGGMTLGTGDSAGSTNWLGAASGGVGAGLGLMNVLKGIEGGSVGQGVGGGMQGLAGLVSMLKSMPDVAKALGLDSGMLGAAGSATQLGGGLFGLGSGISNLLSGEGSDAANIGSVASGALSAAQGGYHLSAALAPAATEAATTALAAALGVSTAALSMAASYIPVVGQVIQAVTSYIGNKEEMESRDAGWWNNPIKGQLYSNATQGVGNANSILDSIGREGMGNLSNEQLQGTLPSLLDSLMPYYQTAQGGRGAIRASDTVTGKNQGPTSNAQPYTGDGASPEQYTQNFTNARTGLAQTIQELMRRGLTYEQLGQLPVNGNWAMQSLDAGNDPAEMFARNYATAAPGQTESRWAEGQRLSSPLMKPGTDTSASPFGGANWLLNESLGAATQAPDSATQASGNMTGMYGGPLWAAIARMGVPELMPLINQNFDPWFSSRTWDPAARQAHYAAEQGAQQTWAPGYNISDAGG